jgi:hypothetical protein
VLQEAFSATMRDEAFLADAKKAGLQIDPVQGKQIETILSGAKNLPKSVTSRMVRARI